MAVIKVDTFGGLATSLGNPPIGTAKAMKNISRHRHRGWLEHAGGYAQKFDGLPQITDPLGDNYLDPAIHKISTLVWRDVANFYCPNNGGRNITVAVGSYRKTGFCTVATTKDRFGVWIRPYWNGATWLDAWVELTEMFIFEILSLPANTSELKIDDGVTFDFDAIDGAGTVFNSSYFIGWTIAYGDFNDTENFDLVYSCSLMMGSGYYLAIDPSLTPVPPGHRNDDYASRVVGTHLFVYRNFNYKDLPTSITSFIAKLYNEFRLSSGNGSTDVYLFGGYIEKQLGKIAEDATTIERVVVETATLDVWRYAALIGFENLAFPTPLPPATYWLKYSIVLQNCDGTLGDETILFDAVRNIGTRSYDDRNFYVNPDALNISPMFSPGALPRRAKIIRIYMSDDNIHFYRVRDITIDALLDSGSAWSQAIIGLNHYGAGSPFLVHYYAWGQNNNVIDANVWAAAGAEAATQLNRSITEPGIAYPKAVAFVGRKTWAGNASIAGAKVPNKGLICATSGDGTIQYDVFPNDAVHQIDMEYGDGDEIIAIGPLSDRGLFLKRQSLILVSPDGQGGYDRLIISKSVGICSAASMVSFEDVVYWMDYNGAESFSPRTGLQLINLEWVEDWKALTAVQKEAATAAIDRVNKLWIVSAASKQWIYDLTDKQWTQNIYTDVPQRLADDIPGTIDFITAAGQLLTIDGTSLLFNGANFSAEYELNKLEVLKSSAGNAYDFLVTGIVVEYETSVPITMTLYMDDSATPTGTPWTLDIIKTKATLQAAFGAHCKAPRIKLAATVTGANFVLKIKSVHVYGDIIEPGGDVLSV